MYYVIIQRHMCAYKIKITKPTKKPTLNCKYTYYKSNIVICEQVYIYRITNIG